MKRTRIVGFGVVALMSLGALIVASASAATFYRCEAKNNGEYTTATCGTKATKPKTGNHEMLPLSTCVAQKKGEYTNSTCATKSAKPKKGSFEKATGLKFKLKGGAWVLLTPGIGSGEVPFCDTSSGSGEYLDEHNASLRIEFAGCGFEGLKCRSFGPNSTQSEPGTIDTNLLNGKLIGHGEKLEYLDAETNTVKIYEPAVGEVGFEITSKEHEPYLWELECGGIIFLRSIGEDAGVFEGSSVNKLSTTAAVGFKAKAGANGLLTEVLTEAGWVGPAPSTMEAGLITITDEAGVEIRS